MPLTVTPYAFNNATVSRVNEVGGVYCLLQQTATPDRFNILYVGLSDDLHRRLLEHYNNPPIKGVTHFHVEAIPGALARALREQALIREFNPPGNVHHTR